MYRKFIFLSFWEISHCDTTRVSSSCQFFILKFTVYIGIFFSPEENVRELTGLGLLDLGFFFGVTDMSVVIFFFLKARLRLQDVPWPAWSIGQIPMWREIGLWLMRLSQGVRLVFPLDIHQYFVPSIVYHSLRVIEKSRVRYCSNPELLSTVVLILLVFVCLLSR